MEELLKSKLNFIIRRYKDDFNVTIFYDVCDSTTIVGKDLEKTINLCLEQAKKDSLKSEDSVTPELSEFEKKSLEEYNKAHPNRKKLLPQGKQPLCLFCGKPVTRVASGFNNTRYAKYCSNKCIQKYHDKKRAETKKLIKEGKKLQLERYKREQDSINNRVENIKEEIKPTVVIDERLKNLYRSSYNTKK
jgi:hypothetical protein